MPLDAIFLYNFTIKKTGFGSVSLTLTLKLLFICPKDDFVEEIGVCSGH